jgi:hypothetical protein
VLWEYHQPTILLCERVSLEPSSIVKVEQIGLPASVEQDRSGKLFVYCFLGVIELVIFDVPYFEGHVGLVAFELIQIDL